MSTKIEILKASGAVAAGSVTGDEVKLQKVYRQATVVLNVTAAASEVDDTLDVYVDTSYDGGTTWVNIGHYTQVLGNGGAKEYAININNNDANAEIGVAADVFTALKSKKINVRFINYGGSDITLLVGIDSSYYLDALKAIHNIFGDK